MKHLVAVLVLALFVCGATKAQESKHFYITKDPVSGAFGGAISNMKPANAVTTVAPLGDGTFPAFADLTITTDGTGKVTAVFDAAKQAARIAAENSKKTADEAKGSVRDAAFGRLKAIDWSKVNTAAELKAVLQDLVTQGQ